MNWLIRLFHPRPQTLRYTDIPVQLPRVDYRDKRTVLFFGRAYEIEICDLLFGMDQ